MSGEVDVEVEVGEERHAVGVFDWNSGKGEGGGRGGGGEGGGVGEM